MKVGIIGSDKPYDGTSSIGSIFCDVCVVGDGSFMVDWTPTDITTIKKGSFKTEKDLCGYIESNIELFAEDVLGEKLVSYKREYRLGPTLFIGGPQPPRADFYIETEHKKAFVEVKNDTNRHKSSAAIGQLLSYGAATDLDNVELILVMPYMHRVLMETIAKYELPIELVLLTKEVLGKWNTAFFKEQERLHANR